MGIQFGSFNGICQTAALVICPLIGSNQGIEPSCYSRNVDIAGTLIFQPCELLSILYSFSHLLTCSSPALPSLATCFVHIVAILMTGIMIYHIRSKYTAVGKFRLDMPLARPYQRATNYPSGRKEIVMFFYLYAIIELLAFFLDSNIIPTANGSYPVGIWSTALFMILRLIWGTVVVRRIIYRLGRRCVLLPSRQRFCWLPVR